MLLNADFSRPASVAPHQYRWVTSPQSGVERVMLDRLGAEQARATSIVRYAPGSFFPRHEHPGGEEILVLSGTFSVGDEHYTQGWYLRNPPGSSHQPYSREGAVIFVKLRQMPADERRCVRVDTHDAAAWQRQGRREICPLFTSDIEQVSLQRLAPGLALFAHAVDGAELLVLAGELLVHGHVFGCGGWLRLPGGTYPEYIAGANGATLYLKTGRPLGIPGQA
ncbi:cupin domain-containing protein [Candidimonas nitroreducens]|uniref:Anti-sigma factor n=1 Tax=Candidimonas nitroreducens TaxID=683354 RepID=A0A225M695_9BURK|nr:cupin domain-containing protein [Candidimonas nitroreducens]OWT56864.1 anti-sigma factor [Candidimonas nitroreducens]